MGKHQKKMMAKLFTAEILKNDLKRSRVLTITQSTYDGVIYNDEEIKKCWTGNIDTLHFDEAWLPHATFHKFYKGFHAIGKAAGDAANRWCFPRNRRTSCWPACPRHPRSFARTVKPGSLTATFSMRRS